MVDKEIKEFFSIYYDGEMDEVSRLDFEEKLCQDQRLAEKYRQFSLGQSLLELLPRRSPNPKLWKTLKKEVRARKAFGFSFTLAVDGQGRSIESDPALFVPIGREME